MDRDALLLSKKEYLDHFGTKRHKLFDYYRFKLSQILKKFCPEFYFIFFKARKNELLAKRRLLSSVIGFLLGYLFCKIILSRLEFEPRLERLLSIALVTFATIGYTLSVQIRVIFWLMIPTFLGSSGRSFIFALIFATLAAGPVSNIINNIHEAALTMICMFNYHRKMLTEKFNLMFEPIKKLITHFGKSNHLMKQKSKKVGAELMPKLTKEVVNEEEIQQEKEGIMKGDKIINHINPRIDQIEKDFQKEYKVDKTKEKLVAKYLRKNDYRCENIFSKALENCSNFFHIAHGKCYEKIRVPLIGPLICIALNAMRVCSLMANFGKSRVCDAKKHSPSGIGEGYQELNSTLEEFEKNFDAQLTFKYFQGKQLANLTSVSQIGQLVEAMIKQNESYFKFGFFIFTKFVSIIFLFVFFKAIKYHNLYLRKIYFDNIYITSYFRHIDFRRLASGKSHLLPLKKLEKMELVDVLNFNIGQKESKHLRSSVFPILATFVGIFFILFFDYFFAQLLKIIETHSEMTKKAKGEAKFSLIIDGEGMIANILKKALSEFEISSKLNKTYTNVECLPRPKQTSSSIYYLIVFYFILIFVINLIQAYSSRLKRIICAFFYPKREKKRILFLYNERLKKRKNFQKYKIHLLRNMAKEKTMIKEPNILALLFSKCLKLKKCVICEEKIVNNFKKCDKKNCQIIYCDQCWRVSGKVCHACDKVQSDDTDLTDDEV